MKNYVLVMLVLGVNVVQAQSLAARQVNNAAQQAAVENGLRLPVEFSQQPVKTYTVNERLSHHKIPGVSFALISEGQIAWAQGYGTTSVSSDEAITVNTVFQAASIAKPVTAFAVMRMQDQGILDINVNIEQYLSSVSLAQGKQTSASPLTFKNLLDHTSGLTGGGYPGYEKGTEIPTDLQTFNGVAPATTGAARVESIPGSIVNYSGAGYTLAEIALADTFKQPFEAILDAWVLLPTGMQHSSFSMDYPQQQGVRVALGHDAQGNTISGGWRIHPEQAAAGLWSTPGDLARLAIETTKAYQGQSQILSQAAAKEMLAPVKPGQDLSAQFGGQPAMTFVVAGEAEQLLFKHGGGTLGYRCFMLMYPQTGDGAVFMTNSDAGYNVGFEMLRAASIVYNWPDFKGKSYTKRQVKQQEQTMFLGSYPFEAGWQADIIQVDQADGIAVKFPNGDIYPLTAVQGDNAYVHEDTGVEVSFNLIAGHPQILLYNQQAGKKP